MPIIYRVSPALNKPTYHSSHGEALKDAREMANSSGYPVEIEKVTVAKLNLPTFLNALNGYGGWDTSVETYTIIQPRKGKR